MDKCGTLFPREDFKDDTGCLKERAHNDAHVCKTPYGKLIKWEEDYECDCGCWDDLEDDGDTPCIVYFEVNEIK